MPNCFFVAPDIDSALRDGYSIQHQGGVLGTNVYTGWKLVGGNTEANVPMHEEWQAWFWLPKKYWTVLVEYDSDEFELFDMPSPITKIREAWAKIKQGAAA